MAYFSLLQDGRTMVFDRVRSPSPYVGGGVEILDTGLKTVEYWEANPDPTGLLEASGYVYSVNYSQSKGKISVVYKTAETTSGGAGYTELASGTVVSGIFHSVRAIGE